MLIGIVCLLSAVSLSSLMWLVVCASRRGLLWSLAVLFLSPIAAFVFAICHWKIARKPFTVFAGSLTAAAATAAYLLVQLNAIQPINGVDDLVAALKGSEYGTSIQQIILVSPTTSEVQNRRTALRGPGDAQAEAFQGQAAAGGSAHRVALRQPDRNIDTNRGKPRTPAPKPAEFLTRPSTGGQLALRATDLANADQHIGRNIEILLTNGRRHSGYLKSADAKQITIEKIVPGGSYAFALHTEQIGSLKVRY